MIPQAYNSVHYRTQAQQRPNLGLGLGLRHVHFDYITEQWPAVDWFEAISENFMFSGGRPRYVLRQVAERYPVVLHGVSLSIGSTAPLNFEYLEALKNLAKEVHPQWISDHLCWTGVLGLNTHDLLPVPLTEEALHHIVDRIKVVQDYLDRPLVLENPSTYLQFTASSIPEPEFLSALVAETGCGLLLDVNNVYVTCFNAGLDPTAYLKALPHKNIVQMHLAGHQHCGTHIIDTHDRQVSAQVWELFRLAWQLAPDTSVLLEWDGNIPDFDTCIEELYKAKKFMQHGIYQEDTQEEVPAPAATTPTPLDFIIPDVMAHTTTQV